MASMSAPAIACFLMLAIVRQVSAGAFDAIATCSGLKAAHKDSGCCGGNPDLSSVCMSKEINPMAADPPVPGVMQGNPKAHVLLAMAPDYPPYTSWTDTTPIDLGGFNKEVSDLMLPYCGIKVDYILAPWEDCWTTKPERIYFSEVNEYVGKAIYNGIVHGCAAYTHTKGERGLSLEFTHSILGQLKSAGIMTRLENGKPVISPKTVDFSGLKMGDVAGWAPTTDTFSLVQNRCVEGEPYFKPPTSWYKMPTDGNAAALTALKNKSIDGLYIYADQAEQFINSASTTEADKEAIEGLGTEFAYIHLGLSGWSYNGTTLAISKRGSGLAAVLNPCIATVSQTKEYTKVCEKYFSPSQCIQNQFSSQGLPRPGASGQTTGPGRMFYDEPDNARTDSYKCANGYCTCDE